MNRVLMWMRRALTLAAFFRLVGRLLGGRL